MPYLNTLSSHGTEDEMTRATEFDHDTEAADILDRHSDPYDVIFRRHPYHVRGGVVCAAGA